MRSIGSARTRISLAAGVTVLAATALVSGLALTGPAVSAEGGDGDRIARWPVGAAQGNMVSPRGGVVDQRIVLHAEELRGADVDVNENGRFNPGDYFLFEEALSDKTGDRVGRDSVRCMRIVRYFRCDGTLALSHRGKIEIAGTIFDFEKGIELGVTGGTGRFDDVSGTFAVTGKRDLRYVVDLVR